ncbi:uncharacterized protein LOC135468574 [Liolophura sinensis]|uniref:uncharacterized protein LOC135468574 n=1 Tax=Liolophura sinensis TaxID=3198878 RepID=UPI00315892FF
MDDCTLEKLSVKPGILSPVFNKTITDYSVTVASNVENITLDLLTSDSGASYSIVGSRGSKTLPLKEGEITEIKIEVTAEDGTTKFYSILTKRLSAKDATLSSLTISHGDLSPAFSPDVTEYYCLLPCNIPSVTLSPIAPDSKNEVLVGGAKPGSPTPLNVGETKVEVEVTSADCSNKQTYVVHITKKLLPRLVKFTSSELATSFECPISLSPYYCPVSIRGSDPKHTFSRPLIDEMTRTSKIDPLSGEPLGPDWKVIEYDIEKKMSASTVSIPLTYGGSSAEVRFSELGEQLEKCNVTPQAQEKKFEDSSSPVKHTVQVRSWEKQMQQIYGESTTDKLIATAMAMLGKYFKSLPKPGQFKHQYEEGESPLDHLQQAAYCYASAIKIKGKDHHLHLQLGQILEERYYAEDMFGLKKQDNTDDFPSLNVQAKESSKDEECAAIARLRGVEAGAPIALQLKAIDQEYHHLVETGQSGKADHVMQLYAWKSKQASQEGVTAQKVSDEESALGQAYMKYLDALVLDDTKSVYNFHVGRLLVVQGSYSEAVPRLEVALHWNPQHKLARCYLGLALALQTGGPGARVKETIEYLLEAMEVLLSKLSMEAMVSDVQVGAGVESLHAENLIRASNVYLLRGLIQLGKLLQSAPDYSNSMSANDVFHTAALLSSHVLPSLCRGDVYKQIEWVLLEAHSNLLNLLATSGSASQKLISHRCQWLSALIEHSSIPQNAELLTLQEKTCQKLVQIQPASSHSLYLLGAAQFAQYESTPGETAKLALNEAKGSFLASVNLEGKPSSGEAPPELIDQEWWKQIIKDEEEKRKAAEVKKDEGGKAAVMCGAAGVRGGTTVSKGRGGQATPARGGGTAPARGGASRGAARGAPRGAPANRGAPSARGAPGRGGKGATPTSSKTSVKTTTSGHKCEAAKPTEKPVEKAPTPTEKSFAEPPQPVSNPHPTSGPLNRKSYQPRLGLARVFHALGESEEAQKYYQEVISMAPEVHDAYIEAADMLLKSNPLAAVDIYSQFPVSDNPSFDDAYISGDIVRILIKHEKFDDPRLEKHMILYGRVLGIGSLEKYVEILDGKFKTDLLKSVYAGVNHKDVDHPDLQAFFKFKCWI